MFETVGQHAIHHETAEVLVKQRPAKQTTPMRTRSAAETRQVLCEEWVAG
jgi:hypothetical protein